MQRDELNIFQLWLENYSKPTVNKLLQKFAASSNTGVDNIMFYIKRFHEIQQSSKLVPIAQQLGIKNPRDIFEYSWKQLEQVVDQFPVKSKGHIQHNVNKSNDLIYNQNNLEIYKADSKQKCIYYGQQHFDHKFTFCISRPADQRVAIYMMNTAWRIKVARFTLYAT